MKDAIQKAIEGGWKEGSLSSSEALEFGLRYNSTALLDPSFWQALGKALGWPDSSYQTCRLQKPYYSNKKDYIGRIGLIVGESDNKKMWYVVWDNNKIRYRYPKTYVTNLGASRNWEAVWHRFIDHLAEGKDAKSFFKELLE